MLGEEFIWCVHHLKSSLSMFTVTLGGGIKICLKPATPAQFDHYTQETHTFDYQFSLLQCSGWMWGDSLNLQHLVQTHAHL